MNLEEFKAAALKYKDSDQINPTSVVRGGQCVYVGKDGNHCLIGQIAIDTGHATVNDLVTADSEGFNGGAVIVRHYVYSKADPDFELYTTANKLQTIADGGGLIGVPANYSPDSETYDPRPWGMVIDLAIKHNIL